MNGYSKLSPLQMCSTKKEEFRLVGRVRVHGSRSLGALPPRRMPTVGTAVTLVQAIHEALQGDLDIRSVLQLEQFKNHVDHLSGRKSKATLIGEFADCISSDPLTWSTFQLFYRAISTSTVENDGAFSQLVRFRFAAAEPTGNVRSCSAHECRVMASLTFQHRGSGQGHMAGKVPR